MGRGGKHRPGEVGALARKRGLRAANARAEKARRERERARQRKHIGAFLPVAVKTAKKAASTAGATASAQRVDEATGKSSLFRWTQAVVELPPTDVTIRFQRPLKPIAGVTNSVGIHTGRRLFRPCPAQLLQSGDRRGFADWLAESLEAAFERSRREKA